jgi:hypothetical protein
MPPFTTAITTRTTTTPTHISGCNGRIGSSFGSSMSVEAYTIAWSVICSLGLRVSRRRDELGVGARTRDVLTTRDGYSREDGSIQLAADLATSARLRA